MIVPMKKVSIVVLDSTRRESVKQLRHLGLVHLEELTGSGPVLQAFKEASQETEKALAILEEIKISKKNKAPQQSLANVSSPREKAQAIIAANDRKKSLLDHIAQDTQELERLANWGSVDPADFVALASKGTFLYMYEIPESKYFSIDESVKTILVNRSNNLVRFLLLSETEVLERPASLPPEAYAVPLPERSTSQIAADIGTAKAEVARIEAQLVKEKVFTDALLAYRDSLASDIEFENVFSGMGHDGDSDTVDITAIAKEDDLPVPTESVSPTALAWLTGYVPVDSFDAFKSACSANGWAYAATEPEAEDLPPTKLKNNKLVSLIYPLTDFLGVNPGYTEFDISGWFLLFFCVFFAMIFADAGYGVLIALMGLILALKSKNTRTVGALVTVLGLSTCVWGVLTCSWFGIAPEKLPQALVDLSFAPISSAKNPERYSQNQMEFCFMLALVQLTVAHLKCIVANRKSLKCLGDIGALMQLWGMFYVVFNMVVDGTRFPLSDTGNPIPIFGGAIVLPSITPLVCISVLAIGFVLSFIFSNYEGSVGKSVLESCKNIISVLLGVVNVFSDTVSYIRLWAVGLAGAAISNTVNTMAGPMLGKLAFFMVAVVLLVFGHGLNMVLNLLSVVVHGVRLNTLEFSQHLGMTWSGTKYSPFRERA